MRGKHRWTVILTLLLLGQAILFTLPAFGAKTSLSLNDRGSEVQKLQEALIEGGVLTGKSDGIFGAQTREAVVTFQRLNGLDTDGIAGPQTLSLLYEKPTENNTAQLQEDIAEEDVGDRAEDDDLCLELITIGIVKHGDRGHAVVLLQNRLNELGFNCGIADGVFGNGTLNAVLTFQVSKGLYADGIVGYNTLSALAEKNLDSGQPSKGQENNVQDRGSDRDSNSLADQIIALAMQHLGKPYVYGQMGPNSFDCSGLVSSVFKHFGFALPRSSKDQGYGNYAPKISRADLMPGDLVFFTTNSSSIINHSGIYIGNGQFIHSSSSNTNGKKVLISPLDSGYYKGVFSWGRRVIKD